ncbi:Predicted N-formylglutamate amidohydrolase [Sphingobium sp. AP50]|uniref:N-formylglutamate amidohydrolase n=1 Tax=Sphingobium sp. AP50 TaxID=1884369 RepID=UPI0008B3E5CB|nr:N-formylglutamate amidohydrolase [Sphingobium sp. AP50]SEK05521.1 Predicted N-formylglutamate amidohydrolase [Sphingobium sp. AP50]
MAREATTLLGPDDPTPFAIDNAEGRSPFLLVGDHAGAAIPAAVGDLGLKSADRARHIAVDIGVREFGRELARLLDAPFIHQTYSRLVIDCNRDPGHEDAMAIQSDGTHIRGNSALDDAARQARIAAIHAPYHAVISAMLDARQAAGIETILLSLHSFTPKLNGVARPWHIGVLHWLGRTEFAMAMLAQLQGDKTICVGDNAPYRMDATDYTIPVHASPRNLPYAELEIRQDLISDHCGQAHWAGLIQKATTSAWR